MINVIVVDDQKLMRDGLSAIINSSQDIRVIAEGSNGEEALFLAKTYQPDLILMDVRMPILNGVEATKRIKASYPNLKILILTTFDDEEYVLSGLREGANGYLLKDIEGTRLLESIRNCWLGELIIPSKVAEILVKKAVNEPVAKNKEDIDTLGFANKEKEIAIMLAQGFTNRQIASAMYMAEGTVKNYVSSIYNKIGISDRTKAALYLKDKGYL